MLMARKTGFLSRNNEQGSLQIGHCSRSSQSLSRRKLASWAKLFCLSPMVPTKSRSSFFESRCGRAASIGIRQEWRCLDQTGSSACRAFRSSYKLLTHELLDRDPLILTLADSYLGYPPVYYPAALTLRRPPYSVIAGRNLPGKSFACKAKILSSKAGSPRTPHPALQTGIQVWPQDTPGPGTLSAYMSEDELIGRFAAGWRLPPSRSRLTGRMR